MITQDDLENAKAAMDKFVLENEPPEGFYSCAEYKEKLYPNLSSRRVLSILNKMVTAGLAERSKNKYENNKVWYYKVMI